MTATPALRVAVLGFPGDHGFGGGLTLLSRLGPGLRQRGGRMVWIDQFYAEDASRLKRWADDGVQTIPLTRPRGRLQRWLEPNEYAGCEKELRAFAPNIIMVAVGCDRIYPGDPWPLKQRLTEIARAGGAKVVMMHQLSEAGQRVDPSGDGARWLDWQRTADWHQFVSEGTWRETEQNFGFSLRGEVVRNNYNVPYSDPPPWPESSVLRMAFVGRFRPHSKGLDLLLGAFADPRLRQRTDWEFSFIGGGEMAEEIRTGVAALDLSSQVQVHGHTTDVAGIWRQHHLLVMPSRCEGLSLSLCEAMLCERPALATLVGGTGDLLIDGQTGFRTDLSADHLAATIERALAAFPTGELQRLGRAAGAQARKVFPAHPEQAYVERLAALLS